jgi:hypothetical protein
MAALVAPFTIKSSRFFQTRLSHPPRTIAFVRFVDRMSRSTREFDIVSGWRHALRVRRSLSVFMDVWLEDGTILEAESRYALPTPRSNENCGYVFTFHTFCSLYVSIFSALNDRAVGMTLLPPVLQWRKPLYSTCEVSKCKVASECRSILPTSLTSVVPCQLSPQLASMTFQASITTKTAGFLLTP